MSQLAFDENEARHIEALHRMGRFTSTQFCFTGRRS
jgi:hypothetical protein